jgi:hypothetical protein
LKRRVEGKRRRKGSEGKQKGKARRIEEGGK